MNEGLLVFFVVERIFFLQLKMLILRARKVIFVGFGLTETVSDYGRIGRALQMVFQLISANFLQVLAGY